MTNKVRSLYNVLFMILLFKVLNNCSLKALKQLCSLEHEFQTFTGYMPRSYFTLKLKEGNIKEYSLNTNMTTFEICLHCDIIIFMTIKHVLPKFSEVSQPLLLIYSDSEKITVLLIHTQQQQQQKIR